MSIRHSPTWATLPGKPENLAGFGLDGEVSTLITTQAVSLEADLQVALAHGWVNFADDTVHWIPLRLTPQGLVIVQGIVQSGDSTLGAIGYLPAGTFPEQDLRFVVDNDGTPTTITVSTTGEITFVGAGSNIGPISMCLSWYIVL